MPFRLSARILRLNSDLAKYKPAQAGSEGKRTLSDSAGKSVGDRKLQLTLN